MSSPRPVLAPALDDYLAKLSRLIRRRASQRAFTEITIVIQDGTPVRVKESRSGTFEQIDPESW